MQKTESKSEEKEGDQQEENESQEGEYVDYMARLPDMNTEVDKLCT